MLYLFSSICLDMAAVVLVYLAFNLGQYRCPLVCNPLCTFGTVIVVVVFIVVAGADILSCSFCCPHSFIYTAACIRLSWLPFVTILLSLVLTAALFH